MICGGLSSVEFIEVRSIALLVGVKTQGIPRLFDRDTRIYRRRRRRRRRRRLLLKFIVGHGDLSQLATLI